MLDVIGSSEADRLAVATPDQRTLSYLRRDGKALPQ